VDDLAQIAKNGLSEVSRFLDVGIDAFISGSHDARYSLLRWPGRQGKVWRGHDRFLQLLLTPGGRSISSGKSLEVRSSNLELPTTGAVYSGSFYYIVNSQNDHQDNGKLLKEDELQPVRIAALKVN